MGTVKQLSCYRTKSPSQKGIGAKGLKKLNRSDFLSIFFNCVFSYFVFDFVFIFFQSDSNFPSKENFKSKIKAEQINDVYRNKMIANPFLTSLSIPKPRVQCSEKILVNKNKKIFVFFCCEFWTTAYVWKLTTRNLFFVWSISISFFPEEILFCWIFFRLWIISIMVKFWSWKFVFDAVNIWFVTKRAYRYKQQFTRFTLHSIASCHRWRGTLYWGALY